MITLLKGSRAILNAVTDAIYPPVCMACPEPVETPDGLCASCWRDVVFISGTCCSACGVPTVETGAQGLCDTCLAFPRPWSSGAAAILYDGVGRDIILRFKHGDRLDMTAPLARWMVRAGARQIARADIIAPIPIHWTRMLKRKYNQAAQLARGIASTRDIEMIPDLIKRSRRTIPLKGLTRAERASVLENSLRIAPRYAAMLVGKHVLLIDDVLTSGATLSVAAELCKAAGADVDILVLARVARDGIDTI